MGLVRTLLALSVVIGHGGRLYGFRMLPGAAAVQGFYILSGFYMSLVLNTKYPRTASGTWSFYQSRYLRLIPSYWFVLVGSLAAILLTRHGLYVSSGEMWRSFSGVGWFGKAYFVLTNIFIVGQDVNMFVAVQPGTGELHWSANYALEQVPAYGFMLIPQAWTLGVELTFYLVAPFLLRQRLSIIMVVLGASLAARLIMMKMGFNYDPWTYRVSPLELSFFLLGNLSYRIYANKAWVGGRTYQVGSLLAVLLAIVAYQAVPGPDKLKVACFYLILVSSIPGMFALTKRLRWDNVIGEWSYPIYLVHMVLLGLFEGLGRHATLVTVVASVVFAAMTSRYLERPIDAFRQRLLQRASDSPREARRT